MLNPRDLEVLARYREAEVEREVRHNNLVRQAREREAWAQEVSLPEPIPFPTNRVRRVRTRIGSALIRLGTRLAA